MEYLYGAAEVAYLLSKSPLFQFLAIVGVLALAVWLAVGTPKHTNDE